MRRTISTFGKMVDMVEQALLMKNSIVPALIKAGKHPKARVRYGAITALGKMHRSCAIPTMIAAIDDSDKEVRCAAITAIGELREPAAVHALIERLKDEDKIVRRTAAKILPKIKDKSRHPDIREGITRPE